MKIQLFPFIQCFSRPFSERSTFCGFQRSTNIVSRFKRRITLVLLAAFQLEISSGCYIQNVFKFVPLYNCDFHLMFPQLNLINNPTDFIRVLIQCKCGFFNQEQQDTNPTGFAFFSIYSIQQKLHMSLEIQLVCTIPRILFLFLIIEILDNYLAI